MAGRLRSRGTLIATAAIAVAVRVLTGCSSAPVQECDCRASQALAARLGERNALFEPGGGALIGEFQPLAGDPRVLFEPGGEALALEIGRLLDRAIATVEQHHQRPFRAPVRIHVFGSLCSFASKSPSPGTIGVTVKGKLLLSPRLLDNPSKIQGVLTHELAHLHFTQYLGPKRAYDTLPRWFAEGFAVLVSGAGADRTSEAEALSAIARGERLTLDGSASTPFSALPWAHGLEPPMYYRQCAMFVRFLQQHYGDAAFGRLLDALFELKPFAQAFRSAFGHTVPETWKAFVHSVHAELPAGDGAVENAK